MIVQKELPRRYKDVMECCRHLKSGAVPGTGKQTSGTEQRSEIMSDECGKSDVMKVTFRTVVQLTNEGGQVDTRPKHQKVNPMQVKHVSSVQCLVHVHINV